MALPPRPVPDPKGGEATSSDFNSCGPRSAAAWVRAFGGNLNTLFIPDVANSQEIAYGINHMGQGFHATVETGDPMGIAGVLCPQGRGLIVGVNCTPDCVPVDYGTGIRHWLDVYTPDGWTFNVWRQTFQRYTNLSQAHNALMGTVSIWRDGWTPPVPPQPATPTAKDQTTMRYFKFAHAGSTDHMAWVGKDGVLHCDNRNDTTGHWNSDTIGPGHQPFSPVEVAQTGEGYISVWAFGANGDRWHWSFDGNKWNGLPD